MFFKFIVSTLIVVGCSAIGHAQFQSNEILNKRISLNVKDTTFIYVLSRLSDEFDIPIGIELASNEAFPKLISIDVEDSALPDLLNLVTSQDSRYKWEISEGVINISPRVNRCLVLERFLDTKVSSFSILNQDAKFVVRERLLGSPDVKRFLDSNSFKLSRFTDSPSPSKPLQLRNDQQFVDTKVRAILNVIILYTRPKMWILSSQNKQLLLVF